ncbi:MAG: chromate transporter [Clostridiales bacterium]|nr:chromate transporter [Clostridiales bacterium]
MMLLQLFLEFFRTGLFAVGGGLATIPFLTDIGQRTGWFTNTELANMIAISESTPGPMGVNMATYVGFETAGVPGAVIATLGLITPSIIVILIIAAFLKRFRDNKYVEAVFYGLRPASTGLIAAAGWRVVCISLLTLTWSVAGETILVDMAVNWKCVLVAVAVFIATRIPKVKNLHPIVWIALSAAAGVVFAL